jgi:hypothetical protein
VRVHSHSFRCEEWRDTTASSFVRSHVAIASGLAAGPPAALCEVIIDDDCFAFNGRTFDLGLLPSSVSYALAFCSKVAAPRDVRTASPASPLRERSAASREKVRERTWHARPLLRNRPTVGRSQAGLNTISLRSRLHRHHKSPGATTSLLSPRAQLGGRHEIIQETAL